MGVVVSARRSGPRSGPRCNRGSWPVVGPPRGLARGGDSVAPGRKPPPPIHNPRRPALLLPPAPATRRGALALGTLALLGPPPLLLLPPSSPSSSAAAALLEPPPPPPLGLASSLAASLEARVHEYRLSNGLRLLVVPRPEDGPVLSVVAHHPVGAWDEPNAQTGYAHMLEHMMFKGTPRTGAEGGGARWREERAALERADDAFEAVRAARREEGLSVEGYSIAGKSDLIPDHIARLEAELARCVVDAARYARQEGGYGARLQAAGAVGLNASTSHDETRYFCSLPAARLELWMALEAERLAAPVFRQLHEEKKVVAEERRARVDASPRGRFVAAMAERAFLPSAAAEGGAGTGGATTAGGPAAAAPAIPATRELKAGDNPYGRPVLGYREDLASVGRRELAAFYRARYAPGTAVLAVVGDVAAATGIISAGVVAGRGGGRGGGGGGAGAGAAASAAAASRACYRVAAMAERYFSLWGAAGGGGEVEGSIRAMADGGAAGRPPPAQLSSVSPLLPEPLPHFGATSRTATTAAASASDGEYVAQSPAGPAVYLAYPRPSLAAGGRDAVALEVATDALAVGRASRFGRALVRPGLALGASLVPGWPGDKHAGAALAAAVPPGGQDADERACRLLARQMQDEADRLASGGIREAELARCKRGGAVGLLSATQSNAGLAGALAAYEATCPGGWRALLSELGELEALTGEQVRAAAERTLGGGRFLAVMLPAEAAAAAAKDKRRKNGR